MNQILSVDNRKKTKKSKNGGSTDINKIVRFFCVFILIFGIGIIGKGSYAIIQGMNGDFDDNQNKNPVIDIQKEGNSALNIIVSHDKEITKISYHWNNETEVVVNGNGTSNIETKVNLPIGNNTFYMKVYDILGKETPYQKEYLTDAEKPQIAFELNGNKLKIVAKDNISLSYITYRWDEEEEVKIEPDEDSKAQMEKEIDIPKGEHTITVVAVNTNNVTETKTQVVKGVTKPKVSITVDSKYLVITATDEEAIKEISYTLNGQKYKIDYSSYREKKVEYRQEMVQGDNRMTGKVINFDNAEDTWDVLCNYAP